MSWLDDLFGVDSNSNDENDSSGNNNNNNNDKNIALDMLVSSKASIVTLAKAAVEAVNPQLRQILSCQLTNAVNEHFRLSDIAVNKQWYNSNPNLEQQIQQDVKEVQNLS
ncbi:spore coat protein [Clostridium thailandense]|nr:spore coat protein [Clostridium thailandense]